MFPEKICYWSSLLETHKAPEFTDTYDRFPSYKLILSHISRLLSSSMESDTGFSLSIRRHLKLIRKCSTLMRLKALKTLTGGLYREQWYRWEICITSYHYKLVGNRKAKVLFSENLYIVMAPWVKQKLLSHMWNIKEIFNRQMTYCIHLFWEPKNKLTSYEIKC